MAPSTTCFGPLARTTRISRTPPTIATGMPTRWIASSSRVDAGPACGVAMGEEPKPKPPGGMTTMDKVTQYGTDNNQTRAASFRPAESIEVIVRSWDKSNNDRVLTMARELCEATATIEAMRSEVRRLNIELATVKSAVPPSVPARLMGPACIRFDSNGVLWMLNRKTDNDGRPLPSKGFGEFGFRFDGG